MSLSSLLIASLSVISGLASPLQALSPVSPALPQLLPVSNLTTLPKLNASSSDNPAFEIQCSAQFGINLDIVDCETAKEYISPDYVQRTWAERHDGLGPTVFPLPYRIMGGQ